MKTKRTTAKHMLDKGDLLDQKWLTYFLAVMLILLILVFVVLSSPTYKRYVVDAVKTVFYGKEQEAPRPSASPAQFLPPALPKGLKF